MYVGKNNLQNDELTFKFASNSDWWFHAKQMPGSHVIVKTNGKELPGAKLEIRDADGNLVEGWTSGKTQHTVRGLELEKEYILTEKRDPRMATPKPKVSCSSWCRTVQSRSIRYV